MGSQKSVNSSILVFSSFVQHFWSLHPKRQFVSWLGGVLLVLLFQIKLRKCSKCARHLTSWKDLRKHLKSHVPLQKDVRYLYRLFLLEFISEATQQLSVVSVACIFCYFVAYNPRHSLKKRCSLLPGTLWVWEFSHELCFHPWPRWIFTCGLLETKILLLVERSCVLPDTRSPGVSNQRKWPLYYRPGLLHTLLKISGLDFDKILGVLVALSWSWFDIK